MYKKVKEFKKVTLSKPSLKKNKEKFMLYSTEGNSCGNSPYSSNCTC